MPLEIEEDSGRKKKKKPYNNIILTVNTTNNWKCNFFSSIFIHLPRRAITPKYSVYLKKYSKEKTKKTIK